MLRTMARELAVRYDQAGETRPLLDRVAMLIVGRQGQRLNGSTGKPTSRPPLDVVILDFLTGVEREAAAWERSLLRIMDRDDPPAAGTKARIAALPDLVDDLGITQMTQALERDVAWWHERCLGYVVESPIERRYKPTHLAAEATGKSVMAFKSVMRRRGIEPIGYMPLSFDGGLTRAAVWDMREVVARL